jgi:hypothetical protein
VLTCFRTVGYLGAACVRVCVALLVGACAGLLLGPLAARATVDYLEGTALGADLSCCSPQPGAEDYLATLRRAAHQLEALPLRLSDLSS